MTARSLVGRVLVATAVAAALALVLGSALGQPVLLSYVETGSMEPTLDAGDGFVAVPSAVAGPVEEGDVVVFRAEEVNGGELTTHRVVEETDRGYVTRGDANPFTDQAESGEPPVKDAQIVAKALQIGGAVVVIPHLGTAVMTLSDALAAVQVRLAVLFGTRSLLGAQGLAYLVFAATAALYAVDVYRDSGKKPRERDAERDDGRSVHLYAAAFALLVVVGATAAMVVPAGTQEFGVVSAEFDSERPDVIPAGESNDVNYSVANEGAVPVLVFLEPASDGVDVSPREMRVDRGERANATLTLSAPPETGYYRQYLVEHRYLVVVPAPVIRWFHALHPWAPVVVIDAVLGGTFYLLTIAVAGTGRVRDRRRERGSSVGNRLRRAIGRLY